MSYNGGVSYKGDKALAQAALPEALKLANMVRSSKDATGLDAIEKVFDIPGGTVRVVDGPYVRHLYIHIESGSSTRSAAERIVQEAFSAYAVFPPYEDTRFPTDPPPVRAAPSAHSAALSFVNGTVAKGSEGVLIGDYNYTDTDTRNTQGSEMDWVSADGIRLYSPVETFTSKYALNLSNDVITLAIKWRGHTLVDIFEEIASGFVGCGIFEGWLIWLTSPLTPGLPQYPGGPTSGWTAKVYAARVTASTSDVVVSEDPPLLLGTFTQEPAIAYGTAAPSPSTVGGSEWFNFSPTGDRAVRCRVFAPVTSDSNSSTTAFTSYKEELVFSLSGGGEPEFVRTITAGDSLSVASVGGDYDDYTEDGPTTVVEGLQPPNDAGHVSVSVDWTETSTMHQTRRTGYAVETTSSGGMLTVAYDYAADGSLASLALDYGALEGSLDSYGAYTDDWVREVHTYGLYSRTSPSHIHAGDEDLHVDTTENRESTNTVECVQSVGWSCDLVYSARSVTYRIPYYRTEGEYTVTQSQPTTNDYSEEMHHIRTTAGPILAADSRTTDYEYGHEASVSAVLSGSVQFDGMVDFGNAITGVVCLDLRHGFFVLSKLSGSEALSGSMTQPPYSRTATRTITSNYVDPGPETYTDTGEVETISGTLPHNDVMAVESTLQCSRTDILYDCTGDSVQAHPLAEVEGLNTSGRPTYSLNHVDNGLSLPTDTGSTASSEFGVLRTRCFEFSAPYLCRSLGNWRAPVVEGVGGSFATDGVSTALISILSTDLHYDHPPEDIWFYTNAVMNCKQATYVYEFGALGEAVYPITHLLWDSVVMFTPRDESGQFAYGQLGVVEFAGGGEAEFVVTEV